MAEVRSLAEGGEHISIARLHGEACFHCGVAAKKLYAAGHITLPGRHRVWPIVVCGSHRDRGDAS